MRRTNAEQQVRERLERHRRRPIEEDIWQDLIEDDYVADAIQIPDRGFADLLDQARERTKAKKRLGGATKPVSGRMRPATDELSHRRAQAVADYFAADAANLPRVRRFRREALAGLLFPRATEETEDVELINWWTGEPMALEQVERAERTTLTDEEADTLLESPAAATLTLAEFVMHQIPIARHRAEIVHESVVEQVLSSRARHAPKTPESDRRWWQLQRRIRIEWDDKQTVVEAGLKPEVLNSGPGPRAITYVDASGTERTVQVWSGSVLGRLSRTSDWLANRNSWSSSAALRFILTGKPPVPWPIEVNYRIHNTESYTFARLELVLEPWMPADEVLRVYRSVQSAMLGGDNRQITQNQLDILDFVTPLRAGPNPMSWKDITEKWKGAFPGRRPTQPNHLYNYWKRAKDKLFPTYRLPIPDEPQP